ncbi:MAG: hypothetical protein L6V93_09365 [Clostridiales bacterium]|nr:MAG: hypothetical protein L6V93_09365 [Clostridiales bacterium]
MKNFDCAISYMQNSAETYFYGGCAEFVLNRAKSKKTRFVLSTATFFKLRRKYKNTTVKFLKKFNKIAVVSNSVGKRLFDRCAEP